MTGKATVGVVLAAFLAGHSLSLLPLSPQAKAAPKDVYGSSSIAVTAYKTNKGSYVLWSDGRITKVDTGVKVNDAISAANNAYSAAPNIGAAPMDKKAPQGSPNVAVGTVPTAAGTYVLFANGSVMKPSDSGASAPPGGSSVRYWMPVQEQVPFGGFSPTGTSSAPSSSGDIDVVNAQGGSLQSGSDIHYSTGGIAFDPPFTETPTVLAFYKHPVTVSFSNGQALNPPIQSQVLLCVPGTKYATLPNISGGGAAGVAPQPDMIMAVGQ